ncbi:MAG: hypothetical protein PSV35_06565, partial [bacterium]|nr:hypothetical protein [bacterium]
MQPIKRAVDEVEKKAKDLRKKGFSHDAEVMDQFVFDLRIEMKRLMRNIEIGSLVKNKNCILNDFKTIWDDRIADLKNDNKSPLNTHRGLFWKLIQSI